MGKSTREARMMTPQRYAPYIRARVAATVARYGSGAQQLPAVYAGRAARYGASGEQSARCAHRLPDMAIRYAHVLIC